MSFGLALSDAWVQYAVPALVTGAATVVVAWLGLKVKKSSKKSKTPEEALREKMADATSRVYDRLSRIQQENDDLWSRVHGAEQELSELRIALNNMEDENSKMSAQLTTGTDEIDKLRTRIKELEAEKDGLVDELEQSRIDINKMKGDLDGSAG